MSVTYPEQTQTLTSEFPFNHPILHNPSKKLAYTANQSILWPICHSYDLINTWYSTRIFPFSPPLIYFFQKMAKRLGLHIFNPPLKP